MEVGPKPQPAVDASQWKEKVKAYHIPRAEVNKVIMEYLVKEGFKDAVMSFQEESGVEPGMNMAILDDQIKIRGCHRDRVHPGCCRTG